jgi:hypothetical protein
MSTRLIRFCALREADNARLARRCWIDRFETGVYERHYAETRALKQGSNHLNGKTS